MINAGNDKLDTWSLVSGIKKLIQNGQYESENGEELLDQYLKGISEIENSEEVLKTFKVINDLFDEISDNSVTYAILKKLNTALITRMEQLSQIQNEKSETNITKEDFLKKVMELIGHMDISKDDINRLDGLQADNAIIFIENIKGRNALLIEHNSLLSDENKTLIDTLHPESGIIFIKKIVNLNKELKILKNEVCDTSIISDEERQSINKINTDKPNTEDYNNYLKDIKKRHNLLIELKDVISDDEKEIIINSRGTHYGIQDLEKIKIERLNKN